MNTDNIILIGMPGSGKSTAGVVLAKFLGYDFVDTDIVIQEKTGKLLRNIIADEGPEGFKKIENDINASIHCHKSVIAPGGSVIYCDDAMKHFKEIGTVIYLKLPLKELETRLGNLEARGVVLKNGQTLADLYNERTPYYDKYADLVVDEMGRTVEETIEYISKAMGI